MTGPRDWDKEMAEIDRLMAADKPAALPSGGGAPANAPARRESAAPSAPAAGGSAPARRRDLVGVWLKVLLGALGGAALLYWPYGKSCGTYLYAYLLGVGAVTAAGLWAMRAAWMHRRGWAHVVGLLVFLLGLGLAAAEILPRVGYAAVAHTWTCP